MIDMNTLFRDTESTANFLSVYEIAKEFRVSNTTIYRLIHSGAFPDCIKVSNCYRVPRSDIEQFITQGGQWA